MFDFLTEERKKILLKYDFFREFLEGKIKEKVFRDNLGTFKEEIISKGITKEDFTNLEEGIHLFKLEKKKKVTRENRLKKIVHELKSLLKETFPREAKHYEITYEQIYEKKSMLGGTTRISHSQSPAYGIFLRLKSKPKGKYEIMHLFKQDLDAKKNIFEMTLNQIPSFKENLKKGIEAINLNP